MTGWRGRCWLWLLAALLPAAPCEEETLDPDVADCVIYDNFLRCAEAYVTGEDMAERQFAASIRFVLVEPRSELCPMARAVAHALSAELAFWLSRPLAEEFPAGAERISYEADVAVYTQGLLRSAMKDLAKENNDVGLLPYMRVLGRILEHAGRTLQFLDVTKAQNFHAAASPEERLRHFKAAAQDRLWDEAWLPALPRDASPLWEVADRQVLREAALMDETVEERAKKQERALKTCFFEAMLHLIEAQERGLLEAFWPHGSTLMALLRHGRLFGQFQDGRMDCVGDDVDFEVLLPGKGAGAWPRFIRLLAGMLQSNPRGYTCYVGGKVDELVQPEGRYEQLLCLSNIDGFECPVSFFRSKAESSPVMGQCLAYDRRVPCPESAAGRLAKYGGCPALPDIELASLAAGNACIDWMRTGLSADHVLELRDRSAQLAAGGFQSMEALWEQPACSKIQLSDRGSAYVGMAAGARLEGFYRQPDWNRAERDSCMPVVRGAEDAPRCRQRLDVVRGAMELVRRTKGLEAEGVAMMLDGPSTCCPPGSSVVDAGRGSGVVLCLAPGPGNFTKAGHAGVYDREALDSFCVTTPSVLMLDPLPTAAGTDALTFLLATCAPSSFVVTSAYLMPGLFEQGAPVFSVPDQTVPGRSWTVWEVPWQ